MNSYHFLSKRVLLPLFDFTRNGSITKTHQLLEKTQWWSEEKILEYQKIKMKMIINYSYRNVPYYHQLFKKNNIKPNDIKSISDLKKIPLLTKQDIYNNYEILTSRDSTIKQQWSISSTGGTTGEPLVFKLSNKSRDFDWAAALRAWQWGGYKIGDRYLDLWSHPEAIKTNIKISMKIINKFRRRYLINTYDISKEKIMNFIPKIIKFNPKFIRGYSSAVYILSQVLNEMEIQPQAVFTTAETLSQDMRKNIEKKFGCRVFDGYSGEGGAHANECEFHEGYHIHVEGVIMEFIKDNEYISFDEPGEIVVTDLNNTIMPFIRYQIGDICTPNEDKCSCGRSLPLFNRLLGRVSDIIKTPSGKLITRPSFFGSTSIKKIKGLKTYQIIQIAIDYVIILITVNAQYCKESERLILSMANDILGDDVSIEIRITDKIPLASSGKRKVIVSKINEISENKW